MTWLMLLFVAVTGVLNTVQSGSNARLAKALGQPWWAAIAVYATGLLAVGVVLCGLLALGRAGWPAAGKLAAAPWWSWCGGVLGATYVMAMLLFAERLGSASFTAITVTAGLLTALLLDHFGLVGFRQHSLNPWRGLGAALLLAGVGLISAF